MTDPAEPDLPWLIPVLIALIPAIAGVVQREALLPRPYRHIVAGLRAVGHTVIVLDMVGPDRTQFKYGDLTDYSQVADALACVNDRHEGLDAVAHLGAIPAPGLGSDAARFHSNMNAIFNVFQASRRLPAPRARPCWGCPSRLPRPTFRSTKSTSHAPNRRTQW